MTTFQQQLINQAMGSTRPSVITDIQPATLGAFNNNVQSTVVNKPTPSTATNIVPTTRSVTIPQQATSSQINQPVTVAPSGNKSGQTTGNKNYLLYGIAIVALIIIFIILKKKNVI